MSFISKIIEETRIQIFERKLSTPASDLHQEFLWILHVSRAPRCHLRWYYRHGKSWCPTSPGSRYARETLVYLEMWEEDWCQSVTALSLEWEALGEVLDSCFLREKLPSPSVAFLWGQCSWLYKAEGKEVSVIKPGLLKFVSFTLPRKKNKVNMHKREKQVTDNRTVLETNPRGACSSSGRELA